MSTGLRKGRLRKRGNNAPARTRIRAYANPPGVPCTRNNRRGRVSADRLGRQYIDRRARRARRLGGCRGCILRMRARGPPGGERTRAALRKGRHDVQLRRARPAPLSLGFCCSPLRRRGGSAPRGVARTRPFFTFARTGLALTRLANLHCEFAPASRSLAGLGRALYRRRVITRAVCFSLSLNLMT